MKRASTITASVVGSCAVLAVAGTAGAVPQFVQSLETPHCDVLMPLSLVDELGHVSVFPVGERIDAFWAPTPLSACPMSDNPNIPNVIVNMINLNTITFSDVHYVADPANAAIPGTTISNEDGLVNAGQAFRIDKLGVNTPLVGESMGQNGLFEPGEAWRFVIDDYQNALGLPADAFLSIGVGAASPGGPSTGSIIALPFPEPASLGLAALAVPFAARRRQRPRDA